MPDISLRIAPVGTGNDPASALQSLNRAGAGRDGGADFATVIDTTAMSILAGTQAQAPNTQEPMNFTPETRERAAVEMPGRSLHTRANDYSQQTEAGKTNVRSDPGHAGTQTKEAFDNGLDEAVHDAAEEVVEEVSETLGVPVQDIYGALQSLDLQDTDLLTEQGLTDTVLAVTGSDPAALLTDGELYQSLQTLLGEVDTQMQALADEFGLTMEQLEDAVQITGEGLFPAEDMMPEEGMMPVQESAPQDAMPQQNEQPVQEEAVPAEEAAPEEEAVMRNAQATEEPRAAQEGPHTQEAAAGTTAQDAAQEAAPAEKPAQEATQTQQAPVQDAGQAGRQTREGTGGQTQQDMPRGAQSTEGSTENAVAQGIAANAEGFLNAVNNAFDAQAVSYASMTPENQAQEIMRQVVENIRTQIRPEVTDIDMQLNPQHLGRVNVHLQAMDSGEMIARFTAQNEQVRAAIENQMPQLQQRFMEQGIKVQEIEVTVSQQGFNENTDRNMNREDQNREQEARINAAGRMRRVRIDLANMEADDIAALDEEDRIEAELMAAEGNTVNYRA